MNGYYLYLGGYEYFFKTERTKLTNKLINDILLHLKASLTQENIDYIRHNVLKAELEIKELKYPEDMDGFKKGQIRKYYNIYGKNFCGFGSFLDDGKTKLIIL